MVLAVLVALDMFTNVTATIDNQGAGGGGGGQGAQLNFTLANTNIAMVAGVQSPGAGGSGGAQTGGQGGSNYFIHWNRRWW